MNSFVIYGATGFFGAANYGASTEDNILQNKWLGGGVAQGVLNLAMTGIVFNSAMASCSRLLLLLVLSSRSLLSMFRLQIV